MRPVVQVACRDFEPRAGAQDVSTIFNAIACPAFPAAPDFDVVFAMQLDAEDVDREIPYALEIVEPDGMSRSIPVMTHRIDWAMAGRPELWWASFALNGQSFPTSGTYEFWLRVDGARVACAEVDLVSA